MKDDVTDYRLRTIRKELYALYKDLGEMIDKNEPSYQDNFASERKFTLISTEARFLKPNDYYYFRYLEKEVYPVRVSGSDTYFIRTVNVPEFKLIPYKCFCGIKSHGRNVDYYVGEIFSDVLSVFGYMCSLLLPLPVLEPATLENLQPELGDFDGLC